ncbi:hypothetical protein KQX54_003116 [Cotesia glomerata]|uniref:PRC-barrel domain-containing protein n=1 Tax=Cotesia glomerata TaxID=32391 RepID=A0AAV7I0F4_COTGL|nr:hypothetical protein KQX54_003116 [Cotesia glomerata]
MVELSLQGRAFIGSCVIRALSELCPISLQGRKLGKVTSILTGFANLWVTPESKLMYGTVMPDSWLACKQRLISVSKSAGFEDSSKKTSEWMDASLNSVE